jgi:hypothetical protein
MRKTASEEKARKGTGMIPALPLGDLSPEKNQNTREMRNNKKRLLNAAFRSYISLMFDRTITAPQGGSPDG